jgi:glutamyl-tRNA synthetase
MREILNYHHNTMRTKDIIKKFAIQNRIKYGKAHDRAVLGKILASNPELRENLPEIREEIRRIVEEVNELLPEELKKLEKSEKSKETKIDRKYEITLPKKPKNVRTRLAPNPNGAMTLGSARGIIVNHYLAKKYDGKFILRFDDTDPKTKAPMLEAYDWYLEDCEFLNAKPDEVYYASDRIHLYYPYAERLIKLGKAYVCFCPQEEFKKLKDAKQECPHRNFLKKKNLNFWKSMLNGEYKEGEAVLRIKTDIEHKDPALRDWVGFRILEVKHPRVGKKYRVWPLLDFESAIEDHLLRITHIIRGKDLMDSERRQKFIYDYFGWSYPEVIHWGRIKIREFGKLSTSGIRRGIILGKYKGWDDPKLPTIQALRRRGITPDAIRTFILNLGITETDISLSLKNLFAENRKIIDAKVNRYFFIPNPITLMIKKAKSVKVMVPFHPSFPQRGQREFTFSAKNGEIELFISKNDADKLNLGENVRLMNLFNVIIKKRLKEKVIAEYSKEKNLNVKKIQWVQVQKEVPGEILMPEEEGEVVRGVCEEHCKNVNVNDVIQFERVGFVRLEEKNSVLKFCFGHK